MLKKQYILFTELVIIFILSVFSVSAQYSSDENTLALWHFDKINNSNEIIDSGPNNYYADGGILVKNGVYGEAVFLNNGDRNTCQNNYVRVNPVFPKLNSSNQFTIEMHFIMFDLWKQPIISQLGGDGQNGGPEPLITLDEKKIRANVAKKYEDGSAVDYFFYSKEEFEIDRWYHVALTYEKPYLTLWINGKQDSKENVGSIGGTFSDIDTIFSGAGTLAIGRSKSIGSSCPYFNGLIDEVRISNIARTNFEINPMILSTTLTKQQILDGLEEERQAKIEEEKQKAEEERRAVELQRLEEQKRLDELEQKRLLEEQQKQRENARKTFLFLSVVILLVFAGYYFRKKSIQKRREEEEKEKERLRKIEERKIKEEQERKRQAEERRKQKIREEEKKAREFETEQRKKGLELFEGRWVKKEEIPKLKEIKIGLENNFADYSPYDFERFIAKLFKAMGYTAEVTRKSGDYGVDVIAKKGEDKIAIQVKKYASGSPVGNREVQMLLGAMQKRDVKANHSLLVTTSHFTVQAKEQARECAIELWDKHDLHRMVKKYLMHLE